MDWQSQKTRWMNRVTAASSRRGAENLQNAFARFFCSVFKLKLVQEMDDNAVFKFVYYNQRREVFQLSLFEILFVCLHRKQSSVLSVSFLKSK